jgi:hypothetical protein
LGLTVTPPGQYGLPGKQIGIGRFGRGPEDVAERWLGIIRLELVENEEETKPVRATNMAKIRMVVCTVKALLFDNGSGERKCRFQRVQAKQSAVAGTSNPLVTKWNVVLIAKSSEIPFHYTSEVFSSL